MGERRLIVNILTAPAKADANQNLPEPPSDSGRFAFETYYRLTNPYGAKKKKTDNYTIIRNNFVFLQHETTIIKKNMVATAYKNRTRDEIIAAFRESIRRKNEWLQQTDEEFKRIREERRRLSL